MNLAIHADPLVDYLEAERRIPVEVATRLGALSVNGQLAFSYRKDGREQYRKMRVTEPTGEKSFRRDRKSAETCLFLEHTLQEDPDLSAPLVICEGEIDALSIASCGIPNVVSVPDGAQMQTEGVGNIDPRSDSAFSWLWDGNSLKPHIAQFNSFVLAVDDDAKGRVLRSELAVRLGNDRCSWVRYPKSAKDANQVLVEHGPSALHDAISSAMPLVPDRLVTFEQIPENGSGEIFTSGFKGLDEGLGFGLIPPELIVVTGEPGSGKTEFTTILGANLANYHQLPGAILQFEDATRRVRETLMTYAVCNVAGVSNRSDARAWVTKWFRTIEPQQSLAEDDDYTLVWLEQTIREARTRHGCRWIVLDPWNELSHIWDRSKSEAIYMNDALRRMKRIARAHQILLIIVCHPTKEGGRQRDIDDLDGYMISGGASWANKSDHLLIVHRPEKAKPQVLVKVAKSKDHVMFGRPGIVRMEYRPTSAQFKYVGMGKE